MKRSIGKWAVQAAAAGALALVVSVPAFAEARERHGDSRGYDSRGHSGSDRGRSDDRRGNSGYDRSRSNDGGRTYRENDRVTAEGRVTSFRQERDGYRVYLEGRRDSYWVPRSRFGRGHDLRVGLSLRLGGIFRGGSIYVDDVFWPGDGGYARDGYIAGAVDRVDLRSDTLWLRDTRSGELVAVEMRDSYRNRRDNLSDLRRGDYVELSGSWLRGGVFEAYRIEDVRYR
ncbi:MAG TPA: hypothetical protein VFN10_01305 [Thermoanaerobaculia bacterium]|nr:hypothetical protein [Thermoanaerobaculia bacterium]